LRDKSLDNTSVLGSPGPVSPASKEYAITSSLSRCCTSSTSSIFGSSPGTLANSFSTTGTLADLDYLRE
ncbi:hypothetical protein DXG01_003804, partial [Tephrocybe rancida]